MQEKATIWAKRRADCASKRVKYVIYLYMHWRKETEEAQGAVESEAKPGF
jgi:hypothetical protein